MQVPREQLIARLQSLADRYRYLEQQTVDLAGSPTTDPKAYQKISKELADLQEIIKTFHDYQRVHRELEEAQGLFQSHSDFQMQQLAKEEAESLHKQEARLLQHLENLWLARHQEPDRPLIIEIRAGTGGLEASLFVADLYRMYSKFAQSYGLKVEMLHSHPSEAGGFKEIICSIKGKGAWQRFKHEQGVHRVQRVPQTETQGRIHTSTATVAVLPEPEEVELAPIPAKDLQIDVYRSSGPGGQGVNTTDSAVRIHHIPTGIIVTCQDERSQLRNKDKAMRVLRARLLEELQRSSHAQMASERKQQVGTGERSEKIRTYNYSDRRVTDHRIGLTLYKLDQILAGDLKEIVDALMGYEQSLKLKETHEDADANAA